MRGASRAFFHISLEIWKKFKMQNAKCKIEVSPPAIISIIHEVDTIILNSAFCILH
jgi:hypothetical protein